MCCQIYRATLEAVDAKWASEAIIIAISETGLSTALEISACLSTMVHLAWFSRIVCSHLVVATDR